MSLLVVLSMVPAGLSRIAVNGLLHSWNLTGANAPYGAIVVYAANAGLGFSIAKGYFDSIDRSVGESAQMDGATQLQIFVKIGKALATERVTAFRPPHVKHRIFTACL